MRAARAAAIPVAAAVLGCVATLVLLDARDVDLNWSVLAEVTNHLVLAAAGAFAAVSGLRTLRQKSEADRRAHWWERATWAFAKAESNDATERALAQATLNHLVDFKLSDKGEAEIIDIVIERDTASIPPMPRNMESTPEGGHQ